MTQELPEPARSEKEPAAPHRSMAELLELPGPLREFASWLMKQTEVSLADVVARTGLGEDGSRAMLAALLDQGFVNVIETGSGFRYRFRYPPKRPSRLPEELWKAL